MAGQVAADTKINPKQVEKAIALLDDGNTVPFIARYRKEVTGELDEIQLRSIEERVQYLRNLSQRKEEVLRLIDEQGKLSPELKNQILQAKKLTAVEDLYRPYRQKRRTRATVAREKGLEPLAQYMLAGPASGDPRDEAAKYVNEEKEVSTPEDAIKGALDIIAETIADEPNIRAWLRDFTWKKGTLSTKAKEKDAESVYEMYYDYREPIKTVVPHRVLAINRGEREGILRVHIESEEDTALEYLHQQWLRKGSVTAELVAEALQDGYRRLLAPAIERDVRGELTEKAEKQAISIFSQNLRGLLLQPPIKGAVVLGVDPAYRTGCKWAVVDETGKLLDVGVVYPTPPQEKVKAAKDTFEQLLDRYDFDVIAIGNGTASRETESFVAEFIGSINKKSLKYIIVNEAGASVYSASKVAAREFPKLDVSERSAVSIARRLQDPLAELVKIEPRSVGVGQYQHDVSPKKLEAELGKVVESGVNYVGVDLNTASVELLHYVSGVNTTVAKNLVEHRNANGRFKSRAELKKVPRLGPKAFEQAAGFLRLRDCSNPLDNTPVHPESYGVAKELLSMLGCSLQDVGTAELKAKLNDVNVERVAAETGAGIPTLRDIIESLKKPGRDPREDLPAPIFRTDVLKLEDLREGMILKGTVRNVVDFGAFVDIGVKVDGLVHISQISDRYVRHPMDVVSVGDVVTVKVLSVDLSRQRVSLSMLLQ
ncbi:MAG: RNA-binding transcriptional accessory protein [Firmicutes bacterium]|nr:RNA-binding transcriptional accessory protein [Bacillota bacterium]